MSETSIWRMHYALKPPVLQSGEGTKPFLTGQEWLNKETADAPANWFMPQFDERTWARGALRLACDAPYLERLCLRGKFMAPDPSRADGLTLNLTYHGGVVVYLNGKELGRANLAKDGKLAEAYPEEAFVTETGAVLVRSGEYCGPGAKCQAVTPEAERRLKSRNRTASFPLPKQLLQPNLNVLALEVVRAPYHAVLNNEAIYKGNAKLARAAFTWNTCELVEARLHAPGGGVTANCARPAGFQVWNADALAGDYATDYGDPCEPLQALELVGARNGLFSGKVLAGSSKALDELNAAASDLKDAGGATIPAANICIRYGRPWGAEPSRGGGFLGCVSEEPPGAQAAGTALSIWVSVKVPAACKPGVYKGTLAIQAKGERRVDVPLQLAVAGWTLPAPQDYRTWLELIQSPETLAVEYDVPLWSDKHFEMIAKSFALISETGSRVVYIPAIAHTNLGNAESMVRWIKKGENQYDFDFSVMDRYLDLCQKHLGTPKGVVLQVWEIYMCSRESIGKRFGAEYEKRAGASNGGAQVTLLDKATGKTELASLPKLSEPASKAIWQALFAGVRARLKTRGLEKALLLGMFTDAVPSKEDVQFFFDLAPDLAWVHHGHGLHRAKLYGLAEVGYQASVWGGYRFADGSKQTNQEDAPVMESLYGWKRPRLDVVFERNTDLDAYPSTRWLFFPETGITGEMRGIGRLGADYWMAIKDKSGRRRGYLHDRFPEGSWGGSQIALNLSSSALAPGPQGPAATNRLFALIEGMQESEARICIEQALTDEKLKARLAPELAKRCREMLDERLVAMWKSLSDFKFEAGGFGAPAWRWQPGSAGHRWFLCSGWQARTEKLFALAGEVEKKLGAGR